MLQSRVKRMCGGVEALMPGRPGLYYASTPPRIYASKALFYNNNAYILQYAQLLFSQGLARVGLEHLVAYHGHGN